MYIVARILLRGQIREQEALRDGKAKPGPFTRFQRGFDRRFELFRTGYRSLLVSLTAHRKLFTCAYLGAALACALEIEPDFAGAALLAALIEAGLVASFIIPDLGEESP